MFCVLRTRALAVASRSPKILQPNLNTSLSAWMYSSSRSCSTGRSLSKSTRPSSIRFTMPFSFQRTFVTSSSLASDAEKVLSEGEKVIQEKLKARFNPSRLQVEDVSGGCGDFYSISITSSAFQGLSTIKQHKLVTEELKKEISGIHGLQIKTVAE